MRGPPQKRSPARRATGGAQQSLHSGRDHSTGAGRRQGPPRPRRKLRRDNRETLRRLTALACHVVYLVSEAAEMAEMKEIRRAAYTLADELGSWHRPIEPHLYGREAGDRP